MMKTMKSRASMEANQHYEKHRYNENAQSKQNANKNKTTARTSGAPLQCPRKRKGVGNPD